MHPTVTKGQISQRTAFKLDDSSSITNMYVHAMRLRALSLGVKRPEREDYHLVQKH
jgi:hypothetical protein